VDGNGQSELALLASGMLAPKAGEIRICGEKVERYSPRSFYRHKVAHIPEDRNRYGLIGGMSIEENLFLKNVETPPASRWKGWYLDHDRIHRQAETWKTRFDIRASSTGQKAADLSGGNQQKVILARELSNEPKFLIAVHPTRGLDVGATNFIHKEIVKMRDRGCGVLLISADLDEVLLLSDRIGVMYEGAITGYEDGTHPNMDTIAQLMAGRREEGICSEA
jgi:simple sugar transport system ATP-binding protein